MSLRLTSFFVLVGRLLLLPSMARAQVAFSIGPQVGANVSSAHFPVDRSFPYYQTDVAYGSLRGLEGGLVGHIRFRHLTLQPAVVYSQKGFSQHIEEAYLLQTPRTTDIYDSRKRLNYLVFPINLVLTQRATGRGLQAFIGAYWGRLTGGTETTSYHTGTTSATGSQDRPIVAGNPQGIRYSNNGYSQLYDAGWQAGIGYRYRDFLLQTSYSWGRRNLAVDYSQVAAAYYGYEPAYYNRAFHVSLAYLFEFGESSLEKP